MKIKKKKRKSSSLIHQTSDKGLSARPSCPWTLKARLDQHCRAMTAAAPPLLVLGAAVIVAGRAFQSRARSVMRQVAAAAGLPTVPQRRGSKGYLTVFCGASQGAQASFGEGACALGKLVATRGYTLLYGGGRCGLMGDVSRSAWETNGAHVVGIMPRFLRPTEGCERSYGDDVTVETMHERMVLLTKGVKAFIALPGGYGTLAELLEVITMKQLGLLPADVPIGVLNVNGFYDKLLEFFKQAETNGFLRLKGGIKVHAADTAEELLASMKL